MKEAQVQKQITDGLKALGIFYIVTHDARYRPITVGITDLIAVLPNRILFIECKGENGKVSEEQMSFIARMRALGHTAFVACGWDDVERFL